MTEHWSVLYVADNDLNQIGPFATQDEAEAAAKEAQKDGTYDVMDQHIYLLTPQHQLIAYGIYELVSAW